MTNDVRRMAGRTIAVLAFLVVAGCRTPLPMPGPVMLTEPADSAVLKSLSVKLSWQAAENATNYLWQVATDSGFSQMVTADTTDSTETVRSLPVDDRYHWRVRPQSSDGVWGEWSETRRFDIQRFRMVANLRTQGYAHDVFVSGSRAYIADGQAGLSVFDVSSPEAPVFLGAKMDSANEAWGVAVRDSYAFVAYGNKELYIVNVSRPESMYKVYEVEYYSPGFGRDVAVADSLVYIAADAKFIVLNCAQMAAPFEVLQYRYPHDCNGVALDARYCYLAVQQLGIAVWRRDTVVPVQVGGMDTPGNARGVAVGGDLLYVADGREGLIVVDVSNPALPREVGSLGLPGYANAVTVVDTLVWLACGTGGFVVVSVAQPSAPRLAAVIDAPYAAGVHASGGYVFGCDRDLGLVVMRQEE